MEQSPDIDLIKPARISGSLEKVLQKERVRISPNPGVKSL